MTLALDASVAAKLFFPEEHSDLAEALVLDAVNGGQLMIAPPILVPEVTNVIRQRMRREGLPLADAIRHLDRLLSLPIEYLATLESYRQALILTERYSLSAFDAQYVALAQQAGCDLWVADEGMLGAIRGRLPFVRWLGDYPIGGPNGDTR